MLKSFLRFDNKSEIFNKHILKTTKLSVNSLDFKKVLSLKSKAIATDIGNIWIEIIF